MRTSTLRSALWWVSLLSLVFLASCDEDDDPAGPSSSPELTPSTRCNPDCPSSQRCVLSAGAPTCLAPNCGNRVCASSAVCQDGTCVFPERTCSPACGTGEVCVYGNCITAWTPSNVCMPLLQCRSLCGTDTSCLSACDRSQSTECGQCRSQITSCESQRGCGTANAVDCCPTEYCACFPGVDSCSDTPCDACIAQNPEGGAGLIACIEDSPICNTCLQPFFDCVDRTGSEDACQEEFCACATCD